VRGLRVLFPLAYIQVSGASVAEAPCEGLRNNKNRKDDACCRVSERTQLAVADKNLVDNIVERAYEQGKHAGHGKFQHEPSDFFRPQKLTGF